MTPRDAGDREPMSVSSGETTDGIKRRIEEIRLKRGYLLPHHGAMVIAAPDLRDAYLQMYAALTQTDRHLTPFEREVVWLAILIAAKEGIGTHHVELFFKEGGTQEQARYLTGLCAFGLGANAFQFMDEAWSGIFPSLAGPDAYLAAFDALIDDAILPRDVTHLALAALQATVGRKWGLSAHIRGVYANGGRENSLVEALSLIMWPVGVNHFLDACGVWVELMRQGAVTPSPDYQLWAETPNQGGHASVER
jgi:alkylhydroperoxidase/carboxymuconolactone decarboxylase family protein YurZ